MAAVKLRTGADETVDADAAGAGAAKGAVWPVSAAQIATVGKEAARDKRKIQRVMARTFGNLRQAQGLSGCKPELATD
jgi:hypothetical protein